MLHKGRPGCCDGESCRDLLLDGRPGRTSGVNQTKRERNCSGTEGAVFAKNLVLSELPSVTKGQGWVLGPV